MGFVKSITSIGKVTREVVIVKTVEQGEGLTNAAERLWDRVDELVAPQAYHRRPLVLTKAIRDRSTQAACVLELQVLQIRQRAQQPLGEGAAQRSRSRVVDARQVGEVADARRQRALHVENESHVEDLEHGHLADG